MTNEQQLFTLVLRTAQCTKTDRQGDKATLKASFSFANITRRAS